MLEEGDFVYQLDQELFLVVSEVTDDSYVFAVHGWREIDKDRLDEYFERDGMQIYKQGEVEDVIDESGTDEMEERFEKLKKILFDVYNSNDLKDGGPHEDFVLDDTE